MGSVVCKKMTALYDDMCRRLRDWYYNDTLSSVVVTDSQLTSRPCYVCHNRHVITCFSCLGRGLLCNDMQHLVACVDCGGSGVLPCNSTRCLNRVYTV